MIPGPTNVPDRVMQAMTTPMINHRGSDFHELYKRIQGSAQKVFQTNDEIVVISGSGTAGVDAAVGSILQPGDTAIVPNYGEFSGRLGESVKYTGANVIAPEADLGTVPRLEDIERAFQTGGKVKALCVVFNETSTGVTWRKLKELKDLASKYGALFVVDAISVLGGEDIPVQKLGIDICIAGSQKCLAAPPGVVILSFSQEAKKAMATFKPRNQYFDIPKYFKFAEHAETPATPAVPLFFALDEALKMVLEEGIEKRVKRHEICANAFYSGFESLGLKPFATNELRSRTVIGIKYPPGIKDEDLRPLLDKKFGVLVAGGFGKLKGSMFRVGSMGMIDQTLVSTTLDAISQGFRYLGYECDSSKALSVAWEILKPLT
ncbi:MAG: pyridoxal-phosphate-dependent aminotransferase family protein [Nitrososphaerales archaeon]